MPRASLAGGRTGAGLGAGTVTGLALHHGGDAHLLGGAARRLLQGDFHVVAQIGAAMVGGTAATTSTAEDVAEDVAKIKTAGAATTHAAVCCGVAVLVVGRALLFVGQGFVGLLGF